METKHTSFPILFITAEIDPVTPKRGYVLTVESKMPILTV